MASLSANAAAMSQSEGHSGWQSISAVCSFSMPEVLCSRDALRHIDKSCCAPLVPGEIVDLVKVESFVTSLSFKGDTGASMQKLVPVRMHHQCASAVRCHSRGVTALVKRERRAVFVNPAAMGSLEAAVVKSARGTEILMGPMKIDYTGMRIGDDLPDGYEDDDPNLTRDERRCGILLHPSSLPGPNGIGEFGEEAFVFLDWLQSTGCTVWQVLPLVPPGRKSGEDGSPYAGADANCGNTLLISLHELVKDDLLCSSDLPAPVPFGRVDFDTVAMVKDPLIAKAAKTLVNSTGDLRADLDQFRKDPRISSWLEEAALFAAIDCTIDAQSWWEWPEDLRDRQPAALEAARREHQGFITQFVAEQFLFQRQWQAVHKHANSRGIRVVGDMPIYVGGHSADVWANRPMFELDPKTGAPAMVSGVPPDAFSKSGQLWRSPLYNWKEMAKDRYSWWANRMRRAFELYDEFRIDHFRGLAGYWAVEASSETAMSGKWLVGPGEDFFSAIRDAVGKVDIIAEDLGVLTTDVLALRKKIKAPGMAVIQFAFGGGPINPHLPHNHEVDQVVYTGTHDNDTVVGWWTKIAKAEKDLVRRYLRFKGDEDVHWEIIRCVISSVAQTAIIPMQDVLGLGDDARMNTPATLAGNWGWRVGEPGIFSDLEVEKKELQALLKLFNRYPRYLAAKEKLAEEEAELAKAVVANGNGNLHLPVLIPAI